LPQSSAAAGQGAWSVRPEQRANVLEMVGVTPISLFNLAGVIRNRLRCPELFPAKAKLRIHCFAFILEQSEGFLLAVLFPRRGRMADLRHRLQAMRNCWFLYEPWRVRPRICQFPPSPFVRQKAEAQKAEMQRCDAIREDMRLLGIRYGQIDP